MGFYVMVQKVAYFYEAQQKHSHYNGVTSWPNWDLACVAHVSCVRMFSTTLLV
jgi:hypothetical protein